MKLHDQYKVEAVLLEIKEDGTTGAVVYDYEERFLYNFFSYRFVFVVIDSSTGFIPDDLDDWYDNVEEAISAFYASDYYVPF